MPLTTSCEFGDVVLLPFPFSDQTATKRRPAVVVSSSAYNLERPDVIVMAISSQISNRGGVIGDTAVTEWRAAGLLKPSVFKPVLATVQQSLLLRTLGKLPPPDRDGLRRLLGRILGA